MTTRPETKTATPSPADRRLVAIKNVFGLKGRGRLTLVTRFLERDPAVPAADPHYLFRPDLTLPVLQALERPNEPIFLMGPTGAGKTTLIEQVCARLNRPVTRINLDGDLTRADFIGQWVLQEDRTMRFSYGPLPRALRAGHVLVVDEIDAASASVLMLLQAPLEGRALTILETGEVVAPHPDFRFCATANTGGEGDESGMYHGTQPQNYALFDRFTTFLKVGYPLPEEELAILGLALGDRLEDEDLERLVRTAGLIRKTHEEGDCFAVMSTRTVLNVARKLDELGDWRAAYELAFLNRLNRDDLATRGELIQKVWDRI